MEHLLTFLSWVGFERSVGRSVTNKHIKNICLCEWWENAQEITYNRYCLSILSPDIHRERSTTGSNWRNNKLIVNYHGKLRSFRLPKALTKSKKNVDVIVLSGITSVFRMDLLFLLRFWVLIDNFLTVVICQAQNLSTVSRESKDQKMLPETRIIKCASLLNCLMSTIQSSPVIMDCSLW